MSRVNGEHFFPLSPYDILHFMVMHDQGRSKKTKQSRAKGSQTHTLFFLLFFLLFKILVRILNLFLFSCFVNIRREKHILQIILFFTNVVDFIISPIICSPFLMRILYIFTQQFPPIKGILPHPIGLGFGHVTSFSQSYLSRCDNTVFPGLEAGMSYIGAAFPAWA